MSSPLSPAGNVVLGYGNNGFTTATAILDMNGHNGQINGLSSTALATCTVDDSLATANNVTLTIGNNNATGAFGGIIKDSGAAATLNIAKTGSGTLTLSGVNTYIGTTAVNGGILGAQQPHGKHHLYRRGHRYQQWLNPTG